jgi:phosphoserine phosphatase RsbU/P
MLSEKERQRLTMVRHDLRTPINHILGYTEMLLEEPTAAPYADDLQRIRKSGRQLLELITQYLDDDDFGNPALDRDKLLHNLRTPVNHVIGYSELLEERAEEEKQLSLLPDLRRINTAAKSWLRLMEEQLVPLALSRELDPKPPQQAGSAFVLAPHTPTSATESIRLSSALIGRVLIVDDDAGNRELLCRRLTRDGHSVIEAGSGRETLEILLKTAVDLVLLDIQMPDLDGYAVLAEAKASATLRHVPIIMVSGFDGQESVARCIEAGAEDYLIKPFDPVLLRARVSACLEKKQLRDSDQRTYQALVESQARLAAELAEAAGYVKSLMPAPLSGSIEASWEFRPSTQLGGDALGYHWIDDTHFAFYLLDVSGHGIGAALLSVSALNVLRSQSLPGVDPRDPAAVLAGLNRAFPMEAHHQQYFSIWYGVFERNTRKLSYASGGHPPAFCIAEHLTDLRTAAPPIGCFPDARYKTASLILPPSTHVLVYSDGAYELCDANGDPISLNDFRKWVDTEAKAKRLSPAQCVVFAESFRKGLNFEDDLSVLWVGFA